MKVHLRCSILENIKHDGKMMPDEHGYYPMILGAFNFHNEGGVLYLSKGVAEYFAEGGVFRRKLLKQALKGEYGHPVRPAGLTDQQFFGRYVTVQEDMTALKIRDVQLDDQNYENIRGQKAIVVRGLVKPCGPYGRYFQEALDDPHDNPALSVRSLTKDYYQGGEMCRELVDIVTWDMVHEPGIRIANKYQSLSLEGFQLPAVQTSEESVIEITQEMYHEMCHGETFGLSQESHSGLVDSLGRAFSDAPRHASRIF